MEREAQSTWIKRGPHRSIAIRTSPEAGASIVKRYRARHLWRRLGDRGRARNEFGILRALHELGLAVPEPYEVRRVGDAWELSCAAIAGARSLLECLRWPASLPVEPAQLARRLGTLVGRAHAAGLVHGDLHAGNLLLDEQGRPWLIDFTRARLVERTPGDVLRRDLVTLAADAREFAPLRLRRRFLVAWRAALGPRSRADLGPAFLVQLEELARARRGEALLEHQDRWSRASGLCERVQLAGLDVLIARTDGDGGAERDAERRERAVAWLSLEPGAHLPGDDASGVLVVDDSQHAARSWRSLGRAWQHRLPGVVPLAFVAGERARGLYRAPAKSAPLAAEARAAEGLGSLHAQLDERGLELGGVGGLWRSGQGQPILGAGRELRGARDGRSRAGRRVAGRV